MDRKSSNRIDESSLTKGQVRRLNALRKSLGNEVGEIAFAEWLAQRAANSGCGQGMGLAENQAQTTLGFNGLWESLNPTPSHLV